MIGRVLWLAALATIAVLTTGLQLDRRARSDPQFAPLIPGLLRNYAQVRITQSALGGKDAKAALAEAQTLVRRRPVPSEYLTLLATSQSMAGQRQASMQTIQIAGQRGWRDPVAQLAVLQLALQAGDKAEASRRYAALFLHDRTPDALLMEVGPAILEGDDAKGRNTLAEIVTGGERWHNVFLRRGAQVMPPAAFAAITADSLRRGAQFDCNVLKTSLGTVAKRDAGAADTLRAAALKRCPKLGA